MATKLPVRFIDEDNYDSASSSDEPSPPSQPPRKKPRVTDGSSPAIARDPQPSEPAATPSPPQAPTNDERDELVEEHLETQAAPTENIAGDAAGEDNADEGDNAAASGADIVEEAAASEKNTGGEVEEVEKDNEDSEDEQEVEDREYLFGPSEDGEGKKSVSEELPWIKEALKAAGLDADGNELPPEREPDY